MYLYIRSLFFSQSPFVEKRSPFQEDVFGGNCLLCVPLDSPSGRAVDEYQ